MAVTVRMLGIPTAMAFVDTRKRQIANGITDGVIIAANNLKEEVKASIEGERAEPKSVDTRTFLNSVEVMTSENSASVVSDVESAKFLEYGTIHIHERRHFRNSLDRNRQKIVDDIKTKIV